MAWLVAFYLVRPVQSVAATAEAVLDGKDDVAVPNFRGPVPREVQRLGVAVNAMLDSLRHRAAETREALREAKTSNSAKSQFFPTSAMKSAHR